MTVNNGSLVSGRVPVTDYANLTADRYQFLSVAQAEPNLGPGTTGNVLTLGTSNTRVWTNALTVASVSATGNITGDYFIGNGSQLSGIAASSVNANALTGNTLSANVIYSSLISVGTLENLSVTGNTISGNLLTVGQVSAVGNITANTGSYFIGNGSQLTGITTVTAVTNQILYGNNVATTFTLNRSTTTAAVLVILNGITQVPGQSYSMVPSPSTNLVFSEAPSVSDVIDIRFL